MNAHAGMDPVGGKIRMAVARLREAADLLRAAGAPKAHAKVRLALSSALGAKRHHERMWETQQRSKTAMLVPTQMEIGRVRNGRPGYAWVDGFKVITPDGKEIQPYMRRREASAFCRHNGWSISK